MADVEASVDISVEGAGALEDAAEAARNLASALRDAEESAGSISGAFESAARSAASLRNDAEEAAKALKSIRDAGLGVNDATASLKGTAEAAGQLRNDLQEVADAEDEVAASGASMGDGVAGLEADAAAAGHLRDELIEAKAAQEALGSAGGSQMETIGGKRYTFMADELRESGEEAEKAKADIDALADSLKNYDGLGQLQTGLAAGQALGDYEDKLASLKQDLADAEPVIESQSGLLDQAAASAERANDEYEKFAGGVQNTKGALSDFANVARDASSSDEEITSAAQDVNASFAKIGPSAAAFGAAFDSVDDALAGVGPALQGVGQDADDAEEATAGLVGSVIGFVQSAQPFVEAISDSTDTLGPLKGAIDPVGGMIGALVGLVGGLGPAMSTAFVGTGVTLGSFAALAIPTLSKVESAYEGVATARSTWSQAEQLAKLDPTSSNIADAATDAAKLKIAYQDIPASIRPVVQALGTLQSQYDSMAKSMQPEVLRVTGDALSALSEGMSQFLKPAATEGGSLLDKGIKDLQTFMESPGAVKTFNDLLKETPGAITSAASAASSVGKFLGDAFGGVGLKGSESFIKTFDQLLKVAGPGAGAAIQGIAGALQNIMGDATQAAPQIGKIAHSLGGLEQINLSSLHSQLESLFKIGGQSGGKSSNPLTQLLSMADQYEKDYDKLPSDLRSRLQTAAGQAFHDIVPGLGSNLKPQTLHWPVNVAPDVHMGHVDTSALAKSLAGGSGLPLPVKVEPKVDPGAMVKSLNMGGLPPSVPATAKVDKVDSTGLKGDDSTIPATAKVDKVDTSAINKAAQNVQIHGVTVNLSDAKLSGLGQLSSSLSSAGSAAGHSFDTGLASGITADAGQARSAAAGVVGDIKAALSTLGAAGTAAGDALGEGLAAGINASKGAAVSAAVNMANAVTAAVKAAHASASPSKVFAKIGSDDIEGYIIGLEGGKSALSTAAKDVASLVNPPFKDATIADTIKDLEDRLKDELKAGDISASQETGISAWLSADNKRLQALAQQRKTLESDISAADSLYKSVDQATIQGANVATFAGNIASQPTMNEWLNSGGPASGPMPTGPTSIQQALRQYLRQTREFRSDIIKLKKEGLDETSLQQLLQAGVTSGLPAANMMLSGGAAGVRQIASLQKQIGAAAGQLGVTGANAAYEPASDIGGGLAAGLQQELSSVSAAIKGLATSIVDEMRGVTPGHTATPILADAGGKGGGDIHIHLDVGGTEIAQVVQKYALQHARRNTGTGLQLKGRGT